MNRKTNGVNSEINKKYHSHHTIHLFVALALTHNYLPKTK